MNAIDLKRVLIDASPVKLMPGIFTFVVKYSTLGIFNNVNLNCVGLAKSMLEGCLCNGFIFAIVFFLYTIYKEKRGAFLLPLSFGC
jgi:hypothetical protein